MTFTPTALMWLFSFLFLLVSPNVAWASRSSTPCDLSNLHEGDIECETFRMLVIEYFNKAGIAQRMGIENQEKLPRLHIDFRDRSSYDMNIAIMKYLAQPDGEKLRLSVQEISILGEPSFGRWNWTEFDTIFPLFENLEILRWSTKRAIPSAIMQILNARKPEIELYYIDPASNRNQFGFSSTRHCTFSGSQRDSFGGSFRSESITSRLQPLVKSQSLHHLQVNIRYDREANWDDMDLVFQILTTSPNIRGLEMSISSPVSIQTRGQPRTFDFHSNPGTKMASLETLSLLGYDLDSNNNYDWKDMDHSTRTDHIANAHGGRETPQQQGVLELRNSRKSNLEEWLEAMDWSKLNSLQLSSHSSAALRVLNRVVPNLRHFSFVGDCGAGLWKPLDASAVEYFIANTAEGLETISLTNIRLENFDNIIDSITQRHGSSLRRLNLTAVTSNGSSPLFLNEASLARLRRSCPNLEALEIDIVVSSEWDYPLLNEIASNINLQHLALRFLKGSRQKRLSYDSNYNALQDQLIEYNFLRNQRDPDLLNQASAQGLFRYLRRKQILSRLESLKVFNFMSIYQNEDYLCTLDKLGLGPCEKQDPRVTYELYGWGSDGTY